AAIMGKIALPEMKKYKYDDALATGTVAAAGTLGILIPPSTVFIVYGILTEQSIGKLFVAGILPGILLSIFFAATVALLCWRKPSSGPPGAPSSWKEKLKALTGIIEAVLLFLLAIGGFSSAGSAPLRLEQSEPVVLWLSAWPGANLAGRHLLRPARKACEHLVW
ncbi:MAG: TRAP transporter large permease subunit, partial [Pseudomonadota bacterium]